MSLFFKISTRPIPKTLGQDFRLPLYNCADLSRVISFGPDHHHPVPPYPIVPAGGPEEDESLDPFRLKNTRDLHYENISIFI